MIRRRSGIDGARPVAGVSVGEAGAPRSTRIAMSSPPSPAPERAARDDAARLLACYGRDRDPAIHEALVERFLPLARHLARRYDRSADADDLEQIASLGLLKAIDRFDPGRGLAFTSFAVPTILGELKRYFRDHGWSIRVPRDLQELALRVSHVTEELTGELGRSPTAAELAERSNATVEQVLEALATATAHRAVSLDQPRGDDDERTAADLGAADDPGYAHVEDSAELEQLLRTLPDRERMILDLRFTHELTQAEIGT